MEKLEKVSFFELESFINKPIVLFGAGNIAKKTIRKIGLNKIDFIVDNASNLHGTEYLGVPVKSPENLNKNHYVIVCSTAISAISSQLNELKFKPKLDYCLSPILNDLLAIQELEELEQTVYFTSGSSESENELNGGGFYKCTISGDNVNVQKIHSGACFGILKIQDLIYFVDTNRGIFSFSNKEGVIHRSTLPKGSRAHGLTYNDKTDKFYVACSYLDASLELNSETFEIERVLKLSNKYDANGEAMHHCNDNFSIGNSLYVTMFSSSGNWKQDSFDGCVAEFDLVSGERKNDVMTGLFMPHNITSINGSLHVLDSLPGHLRTFNFSIQGTFPAFTRGLAYSGGLYYIGQSKNRNFSKVLGLTNNISIDCGIIVWHPELKVSRFIPLSMRIGEIHSIIVG
jgi:hypothetical protein